MSSDLYIENGKIIKITEFKEEEGKTIYEVIRLIGGKPLFYVEHYDRMAFSFNLINMEIPFTKDELLENINKLVKNNKRSIGNIKVTYNVDANVLKVFFIKHKYPTKKMYTEGVKTILYFGERENPNAKIINNNFREKVDEKLAIQEAFEAILVDRNGIITEGSKSNIFMIKENRLYTSKIETVLPGITRTEIIKMAIEMNVLVIEKDIRYIDLNEFDALFISGTSPKILPIAKVEEESFDCKNELLLKLMEKFNKRIEDYIQNS